MGKRGPAPAPTELKLVRGDRKSRVNRAEPTPDEMAVVPPEWLSAPSVEVWDRYAPDLIRKKVLTFWDIEAFAGWCAAVVQRQIAIEELELGGAVIDAPVFDHHGVQSGTRVVKSPWFSVWKESGEVIARVGARFGLTPADRGQLSIGGGEKENREGRLLSG